MLFSTQVLHFGERSSRLSLPPSLQGLSWIALDLVFILKGMAPLSVSMVAPG